MVTVLQAWRDAWVLLVLANGFLFVFTVLALASAEALGASQEGATRLSLGERFAARLARSRKLPNHPVSKDASNRSWAVLFAEHDTAAVQLDRANGGLFIVAHSAALLMFIVGAVQWYSSVLATSEGSIGPHAAEAWTIFAVDIFVVVGVLMRERVRWERRLPFEVRFVLHASSILTMLDSARNPIGRVEAESHTRLLESILRRRTPRADLSALGSAAASQWDARVAGWVADTVRTTPYPESGRSWSEWLRERVFGAADLVVRPRMSAVRHASPLPDLPPDPFMKRARLALVVSGMVAAAGAVCTVTARVTEGNGSASLDPHDLSGWLEAISATIPVVGSVLALVPIICRGRRGHRSPLGKGL